MVSRFPLPVIEATDETIVETAASSDDEVIRELVAEYRAVKANPWGFSLKRIHLLSDEAVLAIRARQLAAVQSLAS